MASRRESSPNYLVRGRVTEGDAGHPARGLRVRVMDGTWHSTESLAEVITGGDGSFQATWRVDPFRARFGRAPDIYLLVHDDRERLLATTLDAIARDAGAVQEIHVHLPGEYAEPPGGAAVSVGGRKVDRQALEELQPEDVLRIAASIFSADGGLLAPRLAVDDAPLARLRPRPSDDLLDSGFCVTPLLRFLDDLMWAKGFDRDTLLSLEHILLEKARLARFEAHPCPPFVIHYTTDPESKSAVRTGSASDIIIPGTNTIVGRTVENGVPDYVQRICFWLHFALDHYTRPPFGFRTPLGGATIQVLVTSEISDGAAKAGCIMIRNNLSHDQMAWLLVHELMHLVQEEYESSGTQGGWHPGREGGAMLAEDFLLDVPNRYIARANRGRGTLREPHNSIKELLYPQSLFLKYLSEQQSPRVTAADEPAIGVETYRVLLESFDAQGYTTEAVESAVAALPWHQGFYRFAHLDTARLDQTSAETLLGNFWLACYLKDFGANVPDRRFSFMERDHPTMVDRHLGTTAPETMRRVRLQLDESLAAGEAKTLAVGAGTAVEPFAARFYRVRINPDVNTFRVEFTAKAGFDRPLVQVVEVERGNRVRDILRSDQTSWSRTIASERDGRRLHHVLVVVSGTNSGGEYVLKIQDAPPAPDVMVTRWNCLPGNHFEIDSVNWAWTWVSPDLWVDSNLDGVADDAVVVGRNNRLFIRLRNQGNLAASGIQVDLWYQEASGELRDDAWRRVQDVAMTDQVLTGLVLAPQSSAEWAVNWAPASLDGGYFSVRAVVTVPGDPNTDNKRCISNFGNVVLANGAVDLRLVRRPFLGQIEEVQVVVIPRARGRFFISQMDLARANGRKPAAGSELRDLLRLRRLNAAERPANSCVGHLEDGRIASCSGPCRLPRLPDPHDDYPTDPRVLPPGMAAADLITVAHAVKGTVIGGFTWAIRSSP